MRFKTFKFMGFVHQIEKTTAVRVGGPEVVSIITITPSCFGCCILKINKEIMPKTHSLILSSKTCCNSGHFWAVTGMSNRVLEGLKGLKAALFSVLPGK